MKIALASIVIIFLSGLAHAQDIAPPALESFTFSPQSVDIEDGPATVFVELIATDDYSGVTNVIVYFKNEEFESYVTGWPVLTSGSSIDGVWTCEVTVPENYPTGIWRVVQVHLADGAGKRSDPGTAELISMGSPTELEVTGTTLDQQSPILTSFSFSPQSVDITDGPAIVFVVLAATDDYSGLTNVIVYFKNEEFESYVTGRPVLASGSSIDGVWTCEVTVPENYPTGIWRVVQVHLADGAGKRSDPGTAELISMGSPTILNVFANVVPVESMSFGAVKALFRSGGS